MIASNTEHADTARPRRRTSPTRSAQRRAAALLIAPFFVLYALVYLAPIVYSAVQSLYTQRSRGGLGFGGTERVFIGLGNYQTVLADSTFWSSLARILLLGAVQVPIMLLTAVVLALLIDSEAVRAVAFFRLVFFLPYAVPGVIAAILWAYLYSPNLSPIVSGFAAAGVHVSFLGQDTVLWSIANIATWSFTGYNMLVAWSALQAVPRDLYEAARIDGASERAIAWHIKLPHLRPALVLSGTLSIIGTMQIFNEPTVLSQVSNAVTSKYVPTMAALSEAFGRNDFSLAAATSVVVAVIAGILSLIYHRVTSRAT